MADICNDTQAIHDLKIVKTYIEKCYTLKKLLMMTVVMIK